MGACMNLKNISDTEITENLEKLVKKEGEVTLEILGHLGEVEEREIYLKAGYSSLYSYTTIHLLYSEPAAMRRIKAARCIRAFPRVRELLTERAVNLSTICLFSSHLSKENEDKLL